MKGFKSDIEKDTLENNNFRKVLYSGKHLQLVLMSLKVGEEIGEEIHHDNDQFFRFESGTGECVIDGNNYKVTNGDVIIIPAGAKHNIINIDSTTELKMYTIYLPHIIKTELYELLSKMLKTMRLSLMVRLQNKLSPLLAQASSVRASVSLCWRKCLANLAQASACARPEKRFVLLLHES